VSGDKRRKLLFLLAGALVLSMLAVVVSLGMDRLGSAVSRSAALEERIRGLARALPVESDLVARRQRLQDELEGIKSRFYGAEEMNPYGFGALIRDRLAATGMDIARYQVLDAKGRTWLEFAASGPATAFVRFLGEVTASGTYWAIPSLSVVTHAASGSVEVVFRIGYETNDD
jgi:hypothetical protein